MNLLLFAALLALTSFFVASEFAIIRIRASRVQQLADEGARNAKAVQQVTGQLDAYLSACQLGITITSLGLGWLGEPTIEHVLRPLLLSLGVEGRTGTVISFAAAFVIVTYLHVVLGELAPKTVALHKAEQISSFTAPYLIAFYKAMYPFIWLLNGSANGLVRLLGFRPASEQEAHSEEEIRHILTESHESGLINENELLYVNNVFQFDDKVARDVMVPRRRMICLDLNNSYTKNLAIMQEEQYTRYPVTDGDKDHVVGLLNTKHLFLRCGEDGVPDLANLLQPVLAVPDILPINRLLRKMQLERMHMAVLLDEFGGTSGLLTIEDIVEEVFGEIRDEFDNEGDQDEIDFAEQREENEMSQYGHA